MKNILKIAFVLAACAVLAPIFLPRHAQAMTARFTDRQLFEGLVLNHGPVAALIPQTGGSAAWNHKQVLAAQLLEAGIQKQHPAFMTDFARDVRSGDPMRVEAALNRGIHLLAVRPTGLHDAAIGQIGVATNVGAYAYVNISIAYVIDFVEITMNTEPTTYAQATAFGREAFARSVATRLHS